jgi:hypothetical protein
MVPTSEITGPVARKLNEEALRSLLHGICESAELPAVVIFREPGAPAAALLDGLHRLQLSRALGFVSIPAISLSREYAEGGYGYVPGTGE